MEENEGFLKGHQDFPPCFSTKGILRLCLKVINFQKKNRKERSKTLKIKRQQPQNNFYLQFIRKEIRKKRKGDRTEELCR